MASVYLLAECGNAEQCVNMCFLVNYDFDLLPQDGAICSRYVARISVTLIFFVGRSLFSILDPFDPGLIFVVEKAEVIAIPEHVQGKGSGRCHRGLVAAEDVAVIVVQAPSYLGYLREIVKQIRGYIPFLYVANLGKAF